MGADTVKIFCPKCNQVYHPPPVRGRAGNASGVDGAAFGTTFPHLFLMTFSNLVPDPLPQESTYIPRVFGFRVHKSAKERNSQALPNDESTKKEEGEQEEVVVEGAVAQVPEANAADDKKDDKSRSGGSSRGSKRRNKEEPKAPDGNGTANPTLLMENPNKRRRRNNSAS